jgi:hypothetical protein
MISTSTLMLTRPVAHVVAATLAVILAIGLLASVTALFQRDGLPLERLVVAERACAGFAYVSEREACISQWLAATRTISTASK